MTYENNYSEQTQWVKRSKIKNFKELSSKIVEIVWNVCHVWTLQRIVI